MFEIFISRNISIKRITSKSHFIEEKKLKTYGISLNRILLKKGLNAARTSKRQSAILVYGNKDEYGHGHKTTTNSMDLRLYSF